MKLGPSSQPVLLHLNLADLRDVLPQPDDLQDASLTVRVEGAGAQGARLVLYRLLRQISSPSAVVPKDIAREPVAEAAIGANGIVKLHGSLAAVIQLELADPAGDHGLLLTAQDLHSQLLLRPVPGALAVEDRHFASLCIQIRQYPKVQLFHPPLRPMPNVYTQVSDGHLTYNGQRLRLWGVCRHFWGGEAVVERIWNTGFNAIRLWGPRNAYTPESARVGKMLDDAGAAEPEASDDSLANFDKFFAEAKARGFFIWMCGLHYDPMGIMHKSTSNGLDGLTQDDSFLARQFGTGSDWEAWKQAIKSYTGSHKGRTWHELSELMFFDPRLKEVYRRQIVNLLNHVNPYTGKRYAEDEAIVTWELNNEEGFPVFPMLYASQDSWPEYFRNELQSQWCQWLTKRYGNDERLKHAWGALSADETLEGCHVKLAPAASKRASYPAARAADEAHFLCDTTNAFNQEMRSLCRAQAPAGVGAAVVPITFDTISEPSAQWMYTESWGDMMSFGTYQFAFHSALTVPPALYIMDSSSVWHRPTLIYETQSIRPDPFRAEYPLRVAALAGWQDWDGVFFHYWKGAKDLSDESYEAAPMDLPSKGYMDGGTYPETDPAYSAALAIAGQGFLTGAIEPAQQPTVYQIPLEDVFGTAEEKGVPMRRATFSRGAYATFEATPAVKTQPPPTVDDLAMPQGAVHAGEQITYDWPNGRMIIDTLTFKAYVGQPHGAYRFNDGIVLEQVSTPFVAFAMASDDGKPLAGPSASHHISITAQCNARNSNFIFDWSKSRGGESSGWNGAWSDALAAAITNRGSAPVQNEPVSYQIDFPTQLTAHLLNYDFARRQTSEEAADGNQLRHAGGQNNVFISQLSIDSRGAAASTPQSSAPQASDPRAAGAYNSLDLPSPRYRSLYMPLALVGWGEGFDAVQQYIRDSTMVYGSLSKELADPAHQDAIEVTEASPLVGLPNLPPAHLQLSFKERQLTEMTVTFEDAQSCRAKIAAAYTVRFGAPAKQSSGAIEWRQLAGGGQLTVTMSQESDHLVLAYLVGNADAATSAR